MFLVTFEIHWSYQTYCMLVCYILRGAFKWWYFVNLCNKQYVWCIKDTIVSLMCDSFSLVVIVYRKKMRAICLSAKWYTLNVIALENTCTFISQFFLYSLYETYFQNWKKMLCSASGKTMPSIFLLLTALEEPLSLLYDCKHSQTKSECQKH